MSATIEENIRLSHMHQSIEPFYDISVVQDVDYYHVGTFDLGDFLLTDFIDENVKPERFTVPVSDEDIDLISSQTNANTKNNTKGSIGVLMNGKSQDLNIAIMLLSYFHMFSEI